MNSIRNFFEGLFGAAAGIVMIGFFITWSIGTLYWLWMAIHLGSFAMFLVLVFPPAMLVTGPVGVYSWIFGPPDWVMRWFG